MNSMFCALNYFFLLSVFFNLTLVSKMQNYMLRYLGNRTESKKFELHYKLIKH